MEKKWFEIINSKEDTEGYFITKKKIKLGVRACFIIKKKKKHIGIVVKEKNKNIIKIDGSFVKLNRNKMLILDKLKKKEYKHRLLNTYKYKEYLGIGKKISIKKLNMKFNPKFI